MNQHLYHQKPAVAVFMRPQGGGVRQTMWLCPEVVFRPYRLLAEGASYQTRLYSLVVGVEEQLVVPPEGVPLSVLSEAITLDGLTPLLQTLEGRRFEPDSVGVFLLMVEPDIVFESYPVMMDACSPPSDIRVEVSGPLTRFALQGVVALDNVRRVQ